MLELLGLNEVQERKVLMCCLGTMLSSSRVVEVAFLQICNPLWELDKASHEQYAETAAVRIYRRKQDTERKGHYPRIGHASQEEWDIVLQLRKDADLHGLRVSERCTKPKQAGARCRHCPPLFFTTRRVKECVVNHVGQGPGDPSDGDHGGQVGAQSHQCGHHAVQRSVQAAGGYLGGSHSKGASPGLVFAIGS